jgi:hypothetical protein
MAMFAAPGEYIAVIARLVRTHAYPLYVQAARAPASGSQFFSSGDARPHDTAPFFRTDFPSGSDHACLGVFSSVLEPLRHRRGRLVV